MNEETAIDVNQIDELKRRLKNKQIQAEERQKLINKYQQQATEAILGERKAREQFNVLQETNNILESKIQGYKKQLVKLQQIVTTEQERTTAVSNEVKTAWAQFKDRDEKLAKISAELQAITADRDTAWSQFKDRDEKLAQVSAELQAITADRDTAWSQFKDRDEKLADVMAKLQAVTADRDTAWNQFKDRDEKLADVMAKLQAVTADRDTALNQLDEQKKQLDKLSKELAQEKDEQKKLRIELSESKKYGAQMATRVGEMEKMFFVKLHNKICRENKVQE